MPITVKDWTTTTTPISDVALEDLETRMGAYTDSVGSGAAQKSANLSDLANAATARTNLGVLAAPTGGSTGYVLTKQADGTYAPAAPLAASNRITYTTKNGSYTLALADAGTAVEMFAPAGTTITLPPVSSVAWTVGDCLEIVNVGTAAVTIAPGSGVSIISKTSMRVLAVAGDSATLRYRGSDSWFLAGALSA